MEHNYILLSRFLFHRFYLIRWRRIILVVSCSLMLSSCGYFSSLTSFGIEIGAPPKVMMLIERASSEERFLFSKERDEVGSIFAEVICIEPPIEAPIVRHTAFTACEAFANGAISAEKYGDILLESLRFSDVN